MNYFLKTFIQDLRFYNSFNSKCYRIPKSLYSTYTKNLSLISAEGIIQDSLLPNHLYLLLAMMEYTKSLIGLGMIMNANNNFQNPAKSFAKYNAAVDFSNIILFLK